jgi:hypothetical protein
MLKRSVVGVSAKAIHALSRDAAYSHRRVLRCLPHCRVRVMVLTYRQGRDETPQLAVHASTNMWRIMASRCEDRLACVLNSLATPPYTTAFGAQWLSNIVI